MFGEPSYERGLLDADSIYRAAGACYNEVSFFYTILPPTVFRSFERHFLRFNERVVS